MKGDTGGFRFVSWLLWLCALALRTLVLCSEAGLNLPMGAAESNTGPPGDPLNATAFGDRPLKR